MRIITMLDMLEDLRNLERLDLKEEYSINLAILQCVKIFYIFDTYRNVFLESEKTEEFSDVLKEIGCTTRSEANGIYKNNRCGIYESIYKKGIDFPLYVFSALIDRKFETVKENFEMFTEKKDGECSAIDRWVIAQHSYVESEINEFFEEMEL